MCWLACLFRVVVVVVSKKCVCVCVRESLPCPLGTLPHHILKKKTLVKSDHDNYIVCTFQVTRRRYYMDKKHNSRHIILKYSYKLRIPSPNVLVVIK